MRKRFDAAGSMRAAISLDQNRLLASVSSAGQSYLSKVGTMVELRFGDILAQTGRDAERVWFPVSGLVSLAISLQDGAAVEVGLVGREGVVGLSTLLDGRDPIDEAVVRIAGQALRVTCAAFLELMECDQSTMLAVLRYSHDLFALVAQTAACNLRHELRPRLARLLLQSDDRSDGGALPFTQALLGTMLGVPRTSVSGAAQQLEQQGAIGYARGRVVVTDRPLLEKLSCECYEAVRSRIGDAARTANPGAFDDRSRTLIESRP